MEINPLYGIGEVKFGMHPSEVKEIMGDKLTWEEWMGGNLNDAIYYPGIVFIFDKCDDRGPLEDASLIEIWTNKKNKELTFQGMSIYKLNKYQSEKFFKSRNLNYTVQESEIYVKDYNLEMAFEGDGTFSRLWLYRRPVE